MPRKRVLLFDVNETLLDLAALDPHFARVFGDARALKPARQAYDAAARAMGVAVSDTRLIAAHTWDVAGALSAGAAAAFVARPGVEWNELVPRPDVWGNDLDHVAAQIMERDR